MGHDRKLDRVVTVRETAGHHEVIRDGRPSR